MLSQNIVNAEKKDKIEGRVFHLFYPDLNTAVLFDRDLHTPIIWGTKAEIMRVITRRLDELMGVKDDTKVKIYSYILADQGYRRIDTYDGPINTISKYIRRY